MPISKEEGKELIKLARQSIDSYFSGQNLKISGNIRKKFGKKQGVFVTITLDGKLRGCIGFPEPALPLYEAVAEAAQSSAFSDPRFPALTREEFKKIRVELSVLTVPELIEAKKPEDYLKKIKIGSDGLIIRAGFGSGLLLPQVFSEYNCDAAKALEMTCEKAGLDPDSWKDLSNKIYKFQAQIFNEA